MGHYWWNCYEINCPECDEEICFETDLNEILIGSDEICEECGAVIGDFVIEQFYGGP